MSDQEVIDKIFKVRELYYTDFDISKEELAILLRRLGDSVVWWSDNDEDIRLIEVCGNCNKIIVSRAGSLYVITSVGEKTFCGTDCSVEFEKKLKPVCIKKRIKELESEISELNTELEELNKELKKVKNNGI